MKENRLLYEVQIQGGLKKNPDLLNYAALQRNEIYAIHMLMPCLSSIESLSQLMSPTAANIRRVIVDLYSLRSDEFEINLSNEATIREARQMAHFFSRMLTDLSLSEIGENFGNRNHATVMHSLKTISNEYDVSPDIQDKIDYICRYFSISEYRLIEFIDYVRNPRIRRAS